MKDFFRSSQRSTASNTGSSLAKKFITLLVAVAFCASTSQAAVTKQCNQNGTYQSFSTVRTCIDPGTGFLVGYIIFSGFTWTSKSDNVTHSFPVLTIENSSQGRATDGGPLCGPDSIETGNAAASDGSGFTIMVLGFNSARIFDAKGTEVFTSAPISLQNPNGSQTCP